MQQSRIVATTPVIMAFDDKLLTDGR